MIAKLKMCTTSKILVKFVSENYWRYLFSKYVVCDQKRAQGWNSKENLEMSVPEIYIYIYIYTYIYIYIYILYIYISEIWILLKTLSQQFGYILKPITFMYIYIEL